MKHVEIVIDQVTQKKIADFVDAVYKTNKKKYKERGQIHEAKVLKDIYRGKLSEYAVYKHYKENLGLVDTTEPDIAIYSADKKSYDADIYTIHDGKQIDMHVKSQHIEQAEKFGLSWSFQKNDPLVFNPIPTDYIVPCLILSNKRVLVYKPIKARSVIKKYKQPKLERLRHTKVVLYGSDVGIKLP